MKRVQRFALRAIALLTGGIAVSAFSTEPLAEFPIREYDELLYVDVDVEGKPHTFILDSGCGGMMLHEKAFGAAIPNGAIKVTDAHGVAEQMRTIPSPQLRFGRASYPAGQPAVILDLDEASLALGREVSGVLGVPLLRGCVVRADWRQGRLLFLEPVAAAEPSWGTVVKVTFDRGGSPCIPLILPNGEMEDGTVDTGSTGRLQLRKPVFRQLIDSKHLSLQLSATSIYFGVHGSTERQGGRLLACELASFGIKDIPVSESSGDSLIGIGLLRRFVVTFDLGNQKIYLAANNALSEKWPQEDCSVGVGQRNGHTTVTHVVLGSRASSSGLQIDDELRAINGESISDWPLGRIRRVLREAESDLTLEVLRDGTAKKIVLPRG